VLFFYGAPQVLARYYEPELLVSRALTRAIAKQAILKFNLRLIQWRRNLSANMIIGVLSRLLVQNTVFLVGWESSPKSLIDKVLIFMSIPFIKQRR
jgi:hypothetical protein